MFAFPFLGALCRDWGSDKVYAVGSHCDVYMRVPAFVLAKKQEFDMLTARTEENVNAETPAELPARDVSGECADVASQ